MRIRVARSSALLVFGILITPAPKKAIRGKFELVIFVSFRLVRKNFSLVSLVISRENSKLWLARLQKWFLSLMVLSSAPALRHLG